MMRESVGGAIFNIDRPVLVEGRVPDIRAVDEAGAAAAGYSVGDTVAARAFLYEDLDSAFRLMGRGDMTAVLDRLNDPDVGRSVDLRVTSIGNLLEDVAIDEGYEPFGGWIGPAVFPELGEPSAGYGGSVIPLTSPAELGAFKSAVDALAPGEKIVYQLLAVTQAKALRATAWSATALAVFAPVTALGVQSDGRPSDISSLALLRSLPVALATALVVLVAFTGFHAMVVAVRRRRRDIAVLQALGSTTRELTAVGVWQVVTIGVVALAVGLPLGIVAGRWVWILLANGFGTLAEPVVPAVGLVGLAVGVLVLTAVVGVLPIRRGLRLRPAEVLRSE